MDNPKVSVIVPIYCVERYLDKCVESLLNQTLKDIEIILVDDGSPDQSGAIADRYAAEYPHIHVIHQENGGLGAARNTGINAATGEYVAFLDSDDWVKEGIYQKLYQVAVLNCADIVVSGHCDVAGDRILCTKPHPMAGKTIASAGEIEKIRKRIYGVGLNDCTVEAFPMSVCMSLYRRDMLQSNGLRFPDGISEDVIFNLTAYKYAQIISFTGDVDYCYRKEEQPSLTHTFSVSKKVSYIEFLMRLKKMAMEEDDLECIFRAQRTVIDTCRMYVGVVNNAKLLRGEKLLHVKEFLQNEDIERSWEGYPVEQLPIQQRVFHWLLRHGWYGAALRLSQLRQFAKKGKQALHGVS